MTSDSDSVAFEFIFNVPVKDVWEAWTVPSLILRWFGSDPIGSGLKATLDLRPGGSYEISFKDSDHTEHTCYGNYKEVKAFTKLSFSWMWKSEPGVESFVMIDFSEEVNLTRMRFQHAHLGITSKHDYLMGWQTTFLKLERLLASNKKT